MATASAQTWNPSAAASELYRAQRAQKQQRTRRGTPVLLSSNREELDDAPRVPPGLTSRSITPKTYAGTALETAAERFSNPNPATTPVKPVAQTDDATYREELADRRAKEQAEAFMQAQNKRRIRAAQATILPAQILAAGEEVPENDREEALGIVSSFQERAGELASKLGQSDAFKKQIKGVQDEAVKQLKTLAKKYTKKGVQTGYRAAGDVSPLDTGEAAFIVLFLGALINAYRAVLTLFAIKRRGVAGSFAKYATDALGPMADKVGMQAPEDKKGMIAELLPGEMDLTDPTVWLADIPLAILGFFILTIVIGIAHLYLAYIGLHVGIGVYIFDFFADLLGLS